MKIRKMFSIVIACLILLTGCGSTFFSKDVHIIYTSDIHGNMDGNLDYASVAQYKNELKNSGKAVVLIDGGDFSSDGLGDMSKGTAPIELMNDIGYDIATLGNHEFEYGIDVLKENLDNAKFDIIGCNIEYTGEKDNPFEKVLPYVIKKSGGKRIAYVGILTPDTLMTKSKISRKLKENGETVVGFYADPNDPDEDGSKIYEVIQNTIDEARSKSDFVVAVAHIGINSNPVINSYDLAQYTHGMDIILDAHSHKEVNEVLINNEGKDVLLFAVGKDLEKMGHVVLKTDGTITAEYIESVGKDPSIENKIYELIEKYSNQEVENEEQPQEVKESPQSLGFIKLHNLLPKNPFEIFLSKLFNKKKGEN